MRVIKFKNKLSQWYQAFEGHVHYSEVVLALVFASCSLSPSLLPRHFSVQGLLTGTALFTGLMFARTLMWLWNSFEVPMLFQKWRKPLGRGAFFLASFVFCFTLMRSFVWQNDLRRLMEMEPNQHSYSVLLIVIALLIFMVFMLIARAIAATNRKVKAWSDRLFPRRISLIVSVMAVVSLVFFIATGLLFRGLHSLADQVFDVIDRTTARGVVQPVDPLASGSTSSLIAWDDIGKQGKNFVATGPTPAQIETFSGRKAVRPIRVYGGFRTGSSMQERAQIVFEEMKRVRAFDRPILVIGTPTGTGWMDEGAVDTLEILHNGNTAIVTMQYSYLPSWITLMVDPTRSIQSAQILFDKVYAHWRGLPKATRPKLYVFGLSLGALGSERSSNLIKIFSDPIDGALWSGPPFPSQRWNEFVGARNPESPQWRPTFQQGALVRFTNDGSGVDQAEAAWGPMRFIYLQHASDPMSFFSPNLVFRRPDWLTAPRGRDVSSYFRWFPIVSFLQTAYDIPAATSVPIGYGHNFAPWEYLDCWISLTDPADWTPSKTKALKAYYRAKHKGKEKS